MANQEEEKQQSPLDASVNTARDTVDVISKVRGGRGAKGKVGQRVAGIISQGTKRVAARLAVAAAGFLAPILAVAGFILFIILLIIIILVAIGIIPSGGSAFASGSGLGVKDNYCQSALSPADVNGDGILNDCSEALLSVLNEAAGAARMPVAVLVAIGHSENLRDVMTIPEIDIVNFSEPGVVLPDGGAINTEGKCATSGDGARGPMQFLPDTFDAHKNFIIQAGARPQGYPPEICNIKDNIFAAAHKLKIDSGIPLSDFARDWSREEIFSAARAYLGACEHQGIAYCENVWKLYNNKKDVGVGVSDIVGAPCGWPVTGRITTLFGGTTFVEDFHSGLDIAANTEVEINEGQDVYNTMTGTVTFARWTDRSGGRIEVSGTVEGISYKVAYVHMSRSAADTMTLRLNGGVNRGEAIGSTHPGALPSSSGTHLHYEVYVDGSLVDPQMFTPERLEVESVIATTGGCSDTI